MRDLQYYKDLGVFNYLQMKEIQLGLEQNLDVEVYASDKYNHMQMEEIRLGLRDKLDVEKYANPEYTWQQMHEDRIKMLQ